MSTSDLERLSRKELEHKVLQLNDENIQLKRLIFGAKRERFIPEEPPASQLNLFSADTPVKEVAQEQQLIQYSRPRRKAKPKREPLPAHLPRKVIIIEPQEDVSGLRRIGEEVTETLDYTPAQMTVIRRVRHKYVDPDNEDRGVLIGSLPPRPIDKGIAEASLLAAIAVYKYVDHLPLYRLAQRFARHGVKLPTSTIGGWITQVAILMTPIYEALKQQALQSGYIQADETRIQVQDANKKGKTHQGCYWTYHAVEPALVWIDYHRTKAHIIPQQTLTEFKGYLQTDAYQAYDKLDIRKDISLFHCWAHARRNFDKALDSDPEKASYALKEIQQLYAIERKLRLAGADPPTRLAVRQEEAVPILERLRQWMDEQKDQCLPKSPISKALNYCLSRWKHFTLYTEDGCLEIDNNLVENIIRPIALGRKNYLFAGSHEAAQRAAVLYSLLATCKLHDVNPYDWLYDVLSRVATHPINRVQELLPHVWKERQAG